MQLHIGAWAACIDEEGLLWLSDFNYNGLYKYNFETSQMTLMHRFNGAGISREAMHAEMYIQGDEIFLLPLKDSSIRIYNKKTHTEQEVKISDEQYTEYSCCVLNDKAWIFSGAVNSDILCFDFRKKNLKKDLKLNQLCMRFVEQKDLIIKKGACESEIFFLNEEKKKLYCVNVNTYQYETFDISFIKENVVKVFFYKGKYWFLLRNTHNIYSYDKKTDSHICYKAKLAEYADHKSSIPYSNMVQWKDELVLLNYYGNHIMHVEETEHRLTPLYVDEIVKFHGNRNYGAYYYTAIPWENSLYFIPQRGANIIECSENFKIKKQYECAINTEKHELEEMFLALIEEKNILQENEEIETLGQYLTNINMQVKKENKSSIGKSIYSKIKDMEEA